jgi:hypothetical protein
MLNFVNVGLQNSEMFAQLTNQLPYSSPQEILPVYVSMKFTILMENLHKELVFVAKTRYNRPCSTLLTPILLLSSQQGQFCQTVCPFDFFL